MLKTRIAAQHVYPRVDAQKKDTGVVLVQSLGQQVESSIAITQGGVDVRQILRSNAGRAFEKTSQELFGCIPPSRNRIYPRKFGLVRCFSSAELKSALDVGNRGRELTQFRARAGATEVSRAVLRIERNHAVEIGNRRYELSQVVARDRHTGQHLSGSRIGEGSDHGMFERIFRPACGRQESRVRRT